MTNSPYFRRAVSAASREITHGIRKSAAQHGWDSKAIRGIMIHHDGNAFKLHTSSDVDGLVWKHEYGDEQTQPTAAIRKYLNDKERLNEIVFRHYVNQGRKH